MRSAFSPHPEEADLLRFLDGELPAAQAPEMQRHLESCWHCRKERNEMQAAIDAFVRHRESVVLPSLPSPPRAWPDLRLQMEAADLVHTPRPPWPLWRFAAAAVFGLAILASTLYFRQTGPSQSPTRPVSAPAPPPAPARASAPRPINRSVPTPSAAAPNLAAVEVAVLHALHLAEADLGEPITVTVAKDEILVTALALPPARVEALRQTLAAIPHVRFTTKEPQAVRAADTAPGLSVTPRPLLFAVREDFANHVIDLSDAITARAHAWNTLEQRFAGRPLPGDAAATIQAMQGAHLTTLRRDAQQLRQLLRTVFPEPPHLTPQRRPLAVAAREFDETVSAAFGGAPSPLSDAALLARLQSVVAELAQ